LGLLCCAIGVISATIRPLGTDEISEPRAALRSDRTAFLVGDLTGGIIAVLAAGIVYVTGSRLPIAGASILLVLVTAGVLAGFVAGIGAAWLGFGVARCRLAAGRRLPWRLMRFLDDAHRRGILRQAGPVYQFRHARLQSYLGSPEQAS
jgi:hypothetical protein